MPATASAENEKPATRFAKDQLKAFVERIERLEEEKKRRQTTYGTSTPKPKEPASTQRHCARSCDCASWVRTSAASSRKCSTPICTLLEWLARYQRNAVVCIANAAVDCVVNVVVARKTTAGPEKRLAIRPRFGSFENDIASDCEGL